MPYIAQVALKHKPELVIFGGDYPTKDGTGTYNQFFKYSAELFIVVTIYTVP